MKPQTQPQWHNQQNFSFFYKLIKTIAHFFGTMAIIRSSLQINGCTGEKYVWSGGKVGPQSIDHVLNNSYRSLLGHCPSYCHRRSACQVCSRSPRWIFFGRKFHSCIRCLWGWKCHSDNLEEITQITFSVAKIKACHGEIFCLHWLKLSMWQAFMLVPDTDIFMC